MTAAPAASVKVEIAFSSRGSDPDATTVWTDVSADLRSVEITRGRQVELDNFSAGSATVVLGNPSARYDPLNTAGALFGNILPMKRIRITAATDSLTPELFEGYVQSWRQGYAGPKEATTTLTCSDAFLLLSGTALDTGFYPVQVRADGARFFYRLGEGVGSTTVTDSISGQVLTKSGAGVFGAPGLVTFDADTAYQQPAGASQGNYLLNNSADVAILGTPSVQSMLLFPSPTQQWVETPDTAAFTGLTAIDVRVRLSTPDWEAAVWQDLVGKGGFPSQSTFSFSLVSGYLYAALSGDGTNRLDAYGALPSLAAGSVNWVGMTAVGTGASWVIKFYTHNDTSVPADITTWTLLATSPALAVGATTLFDSTTKPSIGTRGVIGTAPAFSGANANANIYQAVVRSSVNGTIIAQPDFTDAAQWAVGDTGGTTGTDSTGKVWTAKGNCVITGAAVVFSVDAIVKWDTTQAVAAKPNWIIAGQGDGRSGWYLNVSAADQLGLGILANGVLVTFAVSAASITDGNPHHVAGTYDSTGTPRVYIDGVLSGSPGTAVGTGFTGNGFAIGLANQLPGQGFWSWPGVIDEVAVYPSVLTAAQLLVQSGLRATPNAGDTTGVRIGRILDQVGWDAGKRAIDGGTVLLQAGALGTDALSYLQTIARSDLGMGLLFITRDGKIAFQDAVHQFDHATPAITLTAANFMAASPQFDDTLIRNLVTATRNGGASQTVTDPASVTSYLPHAFSMSALEVADDSVALQAAKIVLAAYSTPAPRVTAVTVDRRGANFATAAEFDALLTADIGDTLRLEYTPVGGVALDDNYIIEGINHVITDGALGWVITYQVSPSLVGVVPAPVTWVYLHTHYATWSAISPRTWDNPAV